jgi:hypothetical protein
MQSAVTHTIPQTEIPALPRSSVNNTAYFKVLCPQKHCFCLNFRKTVTRLIVCLLRLGQASSVSYKLVHRYVTVCGLNSEEWQALIDTVWKLSVQHDANHFLIV